MSYSSFWTCLKLLKLNRNPPSYSSAQKDFNCDIVVYFNFSKYWCLVLDGCPVFGSTRLCKCRFCACQAEP